MRKRERERQERKGWRKNRDKEGERLKQKVTGKTKGNKGKEEDKGGRRQGAQFRMEEGGGVRDPTGGCHGGPGCVLDTPLFHKTASRITQRSRQLTPTRRRCGVSQVSEQIWMREDDLSSSLVVCLVAWLDGWMVCWVNSWLVGSGWIERKDGVMLALA